MKNQQLGQPTGTLVLRKVENKDNMLASAHAPVRGS